MTDPTLTLKDVRERALCRDQYSETEMLKAVEWDWDQLDRQTRASTGACVVANQRQDEALIEWAKATGRFTRIDRGTFWSNPFVAPADGDRETILGRFRVEALPGLVPQLPSLRGRVLGCWCHPAPCHGHMLAEAVNQDAPPTAPPPERLPSYPQRHQDRRQGCGDHP